jgi:hypothetical protein
MTNLPAIRVLRTVALFFLLGCVSVGASAQIVPYTPLFPRDTKECQSFSKDVQAYEADYAEQHQKCLASAKADRNDETHDALVCSRSSCQYLHDILYGNSVLSAKSLQKEVSACYEKVREYQAEEARKAKEKADQEAQDEKDEAARRQQAKDARNAHDQKRAADLAAREKADKAESDARRADAERIAAQQAQQYTQQLTSPVRSVQQTSPKSSQNSSSLTLADPFKDSKSAKSQTQEIASNARLVDPFESKASLVDPFSKSDVSRKNEEAWDGAKGIFQGIVDKRADELEGVLKSARNEMSPEEFRKFQPVIRDAHSFLNGLSKTITVVRFTQEVKKVYDNPGNSDSYHDIITDGASHGFSYVLKRISPDFLSKIYEGPIGWAASITFDSSSTQTPKQDFDPMTALNNPSQYSFQQREAALQSLYQSAQKHPEIWNQTKYQWLYGVSERLYNSPDNPNIHLTPP